MNTDLAAQRAIDRLKRWGFEALTETDKTLATVWLTEAGVGNHGFARFLASKRGENGYRAIFLPWSARPGRSAEWYEEQKRDVLARTDATDDLFQEYPATDFEALAPRSLDRRFAADSGQRPVLFPAHGTAVCRYGVEDWYERYCYSR